MRLIDAEALKLSMMLIAPGETKKYCYPCREILKAINDAPTIEERKKGEWLPGREVSRTFVGPNNVRIDYEDWRCSVCGCVVEQWWKPEYKFCPNCGTNMMKGEYIAVN